MGPESGPGLGTVIVVDDETTIRVSLRRLLRAAGHAVRTYSSAQRLPHDARPAGPSCIIVDLHLPGESGLAFKLALDRAGVRVPTIFVTGSHDVFSAVRAMKCGAFDLLTRPFAPDDLLRAVETALDADARLLDVERRLAELRARFETLTAREREVFFAVSRGLLNKQVAVELGVSEKTVKVHRGRVTEKLAADSVAALVRMADRLQPATGGAAAAADLVTSHAPLAFT